MKREGRKITKLEEKALNALVAWHRDWKRNFGNEPDENCGYTKHDIRLFKLAGAVSIVYKQVAKQRSTARRSTSSARDV
jgi:hypothetical protein